LEQRCFARTAAVLRDEYADVGLTHKEAEKVEALGTAREHWPVVPSELRGGDFGPLLLTTNALYNLGRPVCTENEGSAPCIPIYRTRFTYVFRVSIPAWFATGALCMRFVKNCVFDTFRV